MIFHDDSFTEHLRRAQSENVAEMLYIIGLYKNMLYGICRRVCTTFHTSFSEELYDFLVCKLIDYVYAFEIPTANGKEYASESNESKMLNPKGTRYPPFTE